MKLSQWHDGKVKPVNVGVYQRKVPIIGIKYAKWDGSKWMLWENTIKDASKVFFESYVQFPSSMGLKWRGIVKDKK